MNRIIIIGNGFDLANRLQTSYSHFINHYWKKAIEEAKAVTPNESFDHVDFTLSVVPSTWVDSNTYNDLLLSLKTCNGEIKFKNNFLETITKKHHIQNWVDIENEYYKLLKDSFKKINSQIDVKKLNSDLKRITDLLSNYLKEIESTFSTSSRNAESFYSIRRKIFSSFRMKDFQEKTINDFALSEYEKIIRDIDALDKNTVTLEELSNEKKILVNYLTTKSTVHDLRRLLISDSAINYFDLVPNNILLLNFNYTNTVSQFYSGENEQYWIKRNPILSTIHIHGKLNSRSNPIIFGFGDEIDDDYKLIENLNDNDYLENIKSIKYLETDNYKKLLEFVNSDNYQIFIFGHSCGNSDRTLLNTLFENKNCVSIKPFYHLKDSDNDNYSEIVRNITRNFYNKPLLRDKVVNKTYCESLV